MTEPRRSVVLVEGESDRVALAALARRLRQDLATERIEIVPMLGITNIRTFAERYGPHGEGVHLVGLYDIGEERHVRRGLAAAGLPLDSARGPADLGFHACDADLEDELLRAVGADRVESVIEAQGDGRSLRLLGQMPAQAGWSREEVLRRFLGSQSGRKARYARHLVEAMDLERAPRALRAVLSDAGLRSQR